MSDFEGVTGEAVEEALARYRRLRHEAMDVKRQVEEISGTAVAKRQTVKITVNVHGEILSMDFPTGAYKRMTPIELAGAIKSTAQEAKAKALEELGELMDPKLQSGLSFKELIQGKADLLLGLPEEPPMPDAVADYLRRGRAGSGEDGAGA